MPRPTTFPTSHCTIVGFPPGGPNDLLAPVIAPGIGERLGRSVVVENKAGTNGEIAATCTPQALVSRLHGATDATIRLPEITKRFIELGGDPQFGSPPEFAKYVADDLAKWGKLARDASLKIE